MRKNKLLIVLFAFLITHNVFGQSIINANFGFDLIIGFNSAGLSNFGTSYANIYKYGFGVNKSATIIDALYIKGANIKFFIMQNFAINLKANLITLENKDILHDEKLDKDTIESNLYLNILNIGIGPKYYFGIDAIKGLFPFIGADAGMIMQLGSKWEVKAQPGTPYYIEAFKDQTTNIEGTGFCASAEAGAEWIFFGIGLTISGGYRYGTMEIAPDKVGVFKNTLLKYDSMNISGPFVNGGVVFYFGSQGASSEGSKLKITEITEEEKYGDYYYAKKDYTKALYYYNEALKKGGTNLLNKKIGLSYYGLNNKQAAKEYFERYLQTNQDDAQVRTWVENMK